MTTIALFNSTGGVGTTTLTYHLAHMLSRLGRTVLAVDLDPQSHLTAGFLDDDDLERLWNQNGGLTVAGAMFPLAEGLGDVTRIPPRPIAENLYLLPGDLALCRFEERLAQAWPASLAGDGGAVHATTAFHRFVAAAADEISADMVLVDVGPNLSAVNRSALLFADHVMVPLKPDVLSGEGLTSLGPTLRHWRTDWQQKALPHLPPSINAPAGRMNPFGYVVMQPSMRLDRPVKAYETWLARIPALYAETVLDNPEAQTVGHELGTVRNYRSLVPLAHDARKPMFDLQPADGAIGSTQRLVQVCRLEFRRLAEKLLQRLDLSIQT